MKVGTKKLLIALMLLFGKTLLPNYSNAQDLEYYVSPIVCVPKYFYCKDQLWPKNNSINCLQWGKCRHLDTINAILDSDRTQKYVIPTISADDKRDLEDLLNKYGKKALDQTLQRYPASDIASLISDIKTALGPDFDIIEGLGLQPSTM